MSILDDAIREHLALKRAHGANDDEVKKLEDEAFGPPQRPDEIDPFAEAPTEFLVSPGEAAADQPEIADENARSGRREPNIADLQEPPEAPAPQSEEAAPPSEAPAPPSEAAAAPPAESPVPVGETEAAPQSGAEPPAEAPSEEHPAGELALPPQDSGPNTAERQAIADQPTEMFDVQAELSGDTSASPPTAPPSPSDEELVDASQEEPRLTPLDPESGELSIKGPDAEVAGQPPAESVPNPVTDEHDEFFSEQRLSDELDQALEAPLTDEEELPDFGSAPAPTADEGAVPHTDEHAVPATEAGEATPPPVEAGPDVPTTEEGTAIFDIESDGDDFADDRSIGAEPHTSAPEPHTSAPEPPTPAPEQRAPEPPTPPPPAAEPPAATEPRPDFDPDTGHEDVLEDTPDFLENAPEDDDLWFEQRPPKDFNFDD